MTWSHSSLGGNGSHTVTLVKPLAASLIISTLSAECNGVDFKGADNQTPPLTIRGPLTGVPAPGHTVLPLTQPILVYSFTVTGITGCGHAITIAGTPIP